MLIGFVAVAAFLLIRYAALRAGIGAAKSIAVAASAPAAIVLVSLVVAAVHARQQPPAAGADAATVSAAAPMHGEATHSVKRRLTARDLAQMSPARGPAVAGYIDALDGINVDADPAKLRFPRGRPITIKGWAGDPAAGPAAALIAVVDAKQLTDITPFYDKSRLDVARHFGARSMEFSGFEDAPVSTAGLAKGRHRITLGIVPPDGSRYYPVPQVRWFELQ